jgi:ssDNA-binding Zn-finger/Zn-ribbon topoisomerase 1
VSERQSIEHLFVRRDDSPVVQDITMDEDRRTEHRAPCARRDLKCGDCGSAMVLRKSKRYGTPYYRCLNFPECKGTLGAHTDGRPRGTPGSRQTRQARIDVHNMFDRIWQQGRMSRPQAYAWMRQVMALSEEEAKISQFSAEQCERLISLVGKTFPGLRNVWERLRINPYENVNPTANDD